MPNQLKTTFQQIRRTPYQSLGAVMVIFLTFFTITIFTLISLGSLKILKYFESAPQAVAFFEKGKDLSTDEINQIKLRLEETGQMATFKYVSISEAEAIYRERNKDDPLLLQLVSSKILPPSIEISAKNIDQLQTLKGILEKQPGVKDIGFYEDIVKSLSSWIKNIRIFGISLIIFLLLQSFMMITTITAMKILRKKAEVEIMQLLGAADWFIIWPFVLEGIIYGLLGAFLGFLLSFIILLYATPALIAWFGEINLLPIPWIVVLAILTANLTLGMLVGALGSFVSVRRFLHK